jgi:hypothetical protein
MSAKNEINFGLSIACVHVLLCNENVSIYVSGSLNIAYNGWIPPGVRETTWHAHSLLSVVRVYGAEAVSLCIGTFGSCIMLEMKHAPTRGCAATVHPANGPIVVSLCKMPKLRCSTSEAEPETSRKR